MITAKRGTIISIGAVLLFAVLAVSLFLMSQGEKLTAREEMPVSEEVPIWEDVSEDDFSELTWTQAFEQLNETMSRQYAFTEWKGIRWQELYNKYLPQIEAAQAKGSFEDYYLTMRAYINEIPDGHVMMSHDVQIDYKYTGGAFGFTVTQLDNGKVIVTWIDPTGPAQSAGLNIGDEIVEWDGRKICNVVEEVSTIFSDPPATSEMLRQKQLSALVRAPIGTKVKLVLSDSRSVELTAYDDQNMSLYNAYPFTVVSVEKLIAFSAMFVGEKNPATGPKGVVETEMMDGDILYVKLWGLFDLDTDNTGTPASTLDLMREAVARANENQCAGMILDLRNNMGGNDDMAADILGLFYSEKKLYEYQQYTFSDELPLVYIEPELQRFNGKIIAIVNSQCVSSGEGVALGIKNLPNGETLGFYGTNGSFGMTGGAVIIPGRISISYPFGRSLDKDMVVQLDSRNGVGGVSPSIRIPMNEENALRMANGEDVELEAAIKALH